MIVILFSNPYETIIFNFLVNFTRNYYCYLNCRIYFKKRRWGDDNNVNDANVFFLCNIWLCYRETMDTLFYQNRGNEEKRSEERRVGKEYRYEWARENRKNN